MQINLDAPIRLRPKVQHYPWGRIGTDSVVAILQRLAPVEQRPYAELWLGDHPNGCADVLEINGQQVVTSLSNLLLNSSEDILGADVVNQFGNRLPFLLKVLSVGRPLSIQAHPNRGMAAVLNSRDAANYPDRNHKPEMAVALTPVRLLYGFRDGTELNRLLQELPELAALCSVEAKLLLSANDVGLFLKKVFIELFAKEQQSAAASAAAAILSRISTNHKGQSPNLILFSELYRDFSSADAQCFDIGIMASLFMNIVTIPVGEALYIAPNTLHAYLDGEMIECMANSDNVVRAGLTNKYIDLPTLGEIVDFMPGKPSCQQGQALVSGLLEYQPPVADFKISRIAGTSVSFPIDSSIVEAEGAAQLLLCTEGRAEVSTRAGSIELQAGDACLITKRAGTSSVQCPDGVVFRATTNMP